MRLSIAQLRALPLLVLGTGVFVLAATHEVPPEAQRADDVAALHAEAATVMPPPPACADATMPGCAPGGAPVVVLRAGP